MVILLPAMAAAAQGSDAACPRVLAGSLGPAPVTWPLGVGGPWPTGPAWPREGFADTPRERAV